MKTIADILQEHTFFQGVTKEDLSFIAGCGKNVFFKQGEIIAKPHDSASEFYLIRSGHVALSIEIPPRKAFIYQTLAENEILGLSWLIPPYLWSHSAEAKSDVHAIAIDANCLRNKCENDPELGYKLMKHLVELLVRREEAIRLHLLDIYGDGK